ncbi:MAG: dockerin type I repeat-containing protein, partial [Verrucomicrobiota bacterium]|nr:dockerin type I repeat-containing protein [Verrucomicrobiota bacterium]
PHLAVWRDGYYASFNVFNAGGTAFLGTQAFGFDRTAMLAGTAATFVSPSGVIASGTPFLPADIDGPTLPAAGAPETFVTFPAGGNYTVFHMHSDFAIPANSTWTTFASVPAAAFTQLCSGTRSCVPNLGGGTMDGIGDRLMFRLAYRNFGDHEAVVGNFSVSSGGVAGIRWFELRNVTVGPVSVFQESTYQPDTTWRWMGSIAMDGTGDIAMGFSASSSTLNPQIRYAGRLVSDPLNTLGQGEATLFAGAGSPTGTGNRWGDYSDMTVDPVDDATFWFTTEYFSTTGSQFNWRTRIGSFKFGPVTPQNLIASGGYSIVSAGPNGVLDPAEAVTVSFGLKNVGGPGVICTTSALTATLQATGGVTNPSAPQTYGATCAGDATSFRDFTFTVDPALPCGSTVTASLVITDGATNYGTLTYTFVTGSLATSFSENFDGVTAPALPAGWVTSLGPTNIAGTPWVTSTTTPNSAPNDAFAPDPSNIGDMYLDSPTIAVPAGGARLSFKNSFATEPTYDGMVLEISINGGAFADITTGGNAFIVGGYTGVISSSFSSPIAGRMAWNGNSSGYITSTINLPAAANGQNVKLRWRMASDNSVAATGVMIDDVTISSAVCGGTAPTASSAVSRKLHAGTPFDIPLPLVPLTGPIGIEDRAGAVLTDHQVVVTFATPVTIGSAAITAGAGSVASTSVSGSAVTINLTGVANAQRTNIMLSNVKSGSNLGSITIPMGTLRGDTNGDGAVNVGDALQTRNRSGFATDATNFRSDVNLDGVINTGDSTVVRNQSGNSLP